MKKLSVAFGFAALILAPLFVRALSWNNGSSGGGVSTSANNTWSGTNIHTASTTFYGNVAISSGLAASGSYGTSGQFLTSGGTGAVPTWTTSSAGTGYAFTKLFDTTLVSDSSSTFTLSSISQSYDMLVAILRVRVDDDTNNNITMNLNGTTGSGYGFDTTYLDVRNGAANVSHLTNSILCSISYNTNLTNAYSDVEIKFPNYATTQVKNIRADGVGDYGAVLGSGIVSGMVWSSTQPITSVLFYPGSTTKYKAGSRCVIFGVTY